MAEHFKPIKGIRSLHHIEFNAAKPGIVTIKKSVTEQPQDILVLTSAKEVVQAAEMPPILPPCGLSDTLKEYLSKQVRQHVPAEFQDELCPKPSPPAKEATAEWRVLFLALVVSLH